MADPAPSANKSRRRTPWGGPVALVLALCLIAGGVLAYTYFSNPAPSPSDQLAGIRMAVQQQAQYQKLADRYTDTNGDLLADTPASNLRNPDVLAFAEIATADPDGDARRWQPFLDHLAAVTGKKIEYWRPETALVADVPVEKDKAEGTALPTSRIAPGTLAQMEAVRQGKLHVSAFSTGAVPGAVNTAGFVPLFCPAPVDGPFAYEMEIIVPAGGPVQKPDDLRGRTIALVSMSSNSGGRAGMVHLKGDHKLVPGRDYNYVFTGSHARSIRVVAAGAVDAACVANDLLQAELESGPVKADQIRSIYKSASFPPLCFGAAHDLDPALANKIKEAFKTFTGLPKIYANAPRRARFAPVDYQKDWAFVREVDGKLGTIVEVN